MTVHVGVHIDRNLLVKQLVFAIQLRLFTLKAIVDWTEVGKFVVGKAMLLTDVVELQLSADGLANDVSKLVHVGHRAALVLLIALVDDDRHYKRLGCWNSGMRNRRAIFVSAVVQQEALLVDLRRLIKVDLVLCWLLHRLLSKALVELVAVLRHFVEDFVDPFNNHVLAYLALHALCQLKRLDRLTDVDSVHLLDDNVGYCIEDL